MRVEDRQGELGRDVQLAAQLADVGDAVRAHQRIAELDLARGAEREGGVRQIGGRQRRQQIAALRAHDAEHGIAPR